MKYEDATKKTIIWETNSEPPKSYIWVKPDGKAYEWIDGSWIISPTVVMVDQVNPKKVIWNGTYTAEDGEAFNPVTVEIPMDKETFVKNGTYTPTEGHVYNEVTVNVPLDTTNITKNGTYKHTNNGGYSTVNVNVPLTELEITSLEQKEYIAPNNGGYSKVVINIPEEETEE